jgi:ADP-heptose:LPS heptosyltransferase
MDSFAQHVAAALNLPSVVLWIVNSPKVFGYDIHTNIIAEPETKKPDIRAAYLSKYNIGGELVEFPYNNEMEIFNIGKILEKFENK